MPILLLTGLSGAGKTTLAMAVGEKLRAAGYPVAIIDGDIYRHTLNKDLGFSEADRRENIRRLGQVAAEKKKEGHIVLLAAINPFEDQRQALCADTGAMVIYVKCALRVLLERDTKGLYKRAMLPAANPQKIFNLTGVNDRYDEPHQPDMVVNTDQETIEAIATKLFLFIQRKIIVS